MIYLVYVITTILNINFSAEFIFVNFSRERLEQEADEEDDGEAGAADNQGNGWKDGGDGWVG